MQNLKIYLVPILLVMITQPAALMAQDNPPPSSSGVVMQQPAPGDQQPVTLQTFYDQLAPYGQWVNWPNYGYIFIPSVAPGFTPYCTSGHWVYDNTYGWMWASDYPWGWATFHYGRWNYDPSYGWFWIPDLNWGPAWVAWRNCTGYYGWAPLPWGAQVNVGFANFNIAPEHWCFVPQDHICEANLSPWFVPRTHNDVFIRNSAIIDRMDYDNAHRFGYFKGPDRAEVEGYIHHPVNAVRADDYRRVPAVVVNNQERHPEERHDQNARQDERVEQRSNPAPGRYVQQNDIPQRGRHR